MKIGLILHPYGEKTAAGLGRSIFSLSKNIVENDIKNEYTIFVKGQNVPIPQFLTNNWKLCRLAESFFWLDRGLSKENQMDVYVFFTPVMPIFYKPANAIVVVHDLGYRHIPASSPREWLTRLVIRLIHWWTLSRANRIVCVSNYTLMEVISFAPWVKNKVEVIYNGFNDLTVNKFVKPNIPEGPFFLFTGVLKKRKNILKVIKAFEEFKNKTGLPHILVLAGRKDDATLVSKAINVNKYHDDIICLGYVSDDELAYLYRNTTCFVFPSLLEGFGMPILEAMNAGAPVITSNIGAMKEVAGGAAYLVDPHSIQSISIAMEKLVLDFGFRENLIGLGFKRARQFSWKKAGKSYITLIHETVSI